MTAHLTVPYPMWEPLKAAAEALLAAAETPVLDAGEDFCNSVGDILLDASDDELLDFAHLLVDRDQPRAVAYTLTEGGDWHPWQEHCQDAGDMFAIKFSNGWIWDGIVGWRRAP